MSLLSSLFTQKSTTAPETKRSRAAHMVAMQHLGQAVWSPRNTSSMVKQGFEHNVVVYRCVRLIAEAASTVPWLLYHGEMELTDHPLLRLLERPNPRQAGPQLFEHIFGHLLLSGNAYVEAVALDGEVRELYSLRPDRMRLIAGNDGWAKAYEYTVGGQSVKFVQDNGGVPPILHLSLFSPNDDHYGHSPLVAAQVPIDIHNAASEWNKALLDNSARPSGALVYAPSGGQTLTDEQYERLKEELETSFMSAHNAGRPLLLEGGLDWKALSLSPKDMDFIEAKNAAAREIALAFGVPPMLLGIPGDNTYANYVEANRAFWRQTVLPMLGRVASSLAHWLEPAYGHVRLSYDVDSIEALSVDRDALWKRVNDANFLSDDEKRAAVGYGDTGVMRSRRGLWRNSDLKFEEGKEYNPNQPRVPAGNQDGGQWTDGSGEGIQNDDVTGSVTNKRPSNNRKFDKDGAIQHLQDNAKPSTTHWCARFVANAIEKGGGLNIGPRPDFAKDFGLWLERGGFQEVASSIRYSNSVRAVFPPDGYELRVGDVAVLQPYPPNTAGHMTMFDGQNWISDFVQRDMWGGSTSRNYRPSYKIYRR